MTTDPRVDAYIAKAAPFAQPILTRLRAVVHKALPEAEEGIKWGMPHFMVLGTNVAGMSAFKAHCAFVIHGDGRQGGDEREGMGGYGKIASLEAIPAEDELLVAIREAAARVASTGTAIAPREGKLAKEPIPMPEDFASALAGSPGARERFDAFPPGAQREYLEWIVTAKRPETRAKRVATACAQSAEGKKMNWKYEGC